MDGSHVAIRRRHNDAGAALLRRGDSNAARLRGVGVPETALADLCAQAPEITHSAATEIENSYGQVRGRAIGGSSSVCAGLAYPVYGIKQC